MSSKQDEFWSEYMRAVAADESRSSFAERMGTSPQRVWQRVYDKQRQGWGIPQLKSDRGRVNNSEFRKVMEQFGVKRNGKASKPAAPKKKPKPAPLPQPVFDDDADTADDSSELDDIIAKLS